MRTGILRSTRTVVEVEDSKRRQRTEWRLPFHWVGLGLLVFSGISPELAHAQGQAAISVRVFLADGVTVAAGDSAQTYVSPVPAGPFIPAGSPGVIDGAGFYNTFPPITLPGFPAGSTVYFQVRAWSAGYASYEAAQASGTAAVGQSVISSAITVTVPPNPPPTVSLPSFEIDAPPALANLESSPISYTENDPATSVTSTLTVTDDGGILVGATVQVSGNYQSGEDILEYTQVGGITGSFDIGTGAMTLSGFDSAASYQQALRSVSYRNTSEAPSTLPRTLMLQAYDGIAPSLPAWRTITISSVNDPPVLTLIPNQTVAEGATLTVVASASDPDLPPQVLTYSLLPGAPMGMGIDPYTGVITWTPGAADGPGSYLVVVQVSDGELSSTTTMQVDVLDVSIAIISLTPSQGATGVGAKPLLEAVLQDGATESVSSASLSLDSVPVPSSSSRVGYQTTVSYTPGSPLGVGPHTAEVAWTTSLGGNGSQIWSFTVGSVANPAALDGAAESLRQLVIAANATPGPDVITLPAGIYSLTIPPSGANDATSGDLNITDDLTIIGAGGGLTIIDANILGDRVFQAAGPTVHLTLRGITIQGGTTLGGGGGVMTYNVADLTLENCEVLDCSAVIGGGIWVGDTPLTLQGTTLSLNSAGDGAGICASNTVVTATDSVIEHNSGSGAGAAGVYLMVQTEGTFVRTRVVANESSVGSGGIHLIAISSLNLVNSEVSGNVGASFAGGVVSEGSTLSATNCTFSGNTLNTTSQGGSALLNLNGTVRLVNCTVASNRLIGSDFGGGIMETNGTTYARNSIFAGNTSETQSYDVFQRLSSEGHNLLQNGTEAVISGDTTGNVVGADPLLGTLQDNGGPTLTHALLVGSPAINAGDNAGVPLTDQRGLPRIFGGTVDIGAFEDQGNVAPALSAATLAGAAVEEIAYPVSFEGLTSATGANDPNGDTVHFVITSVSDNGLLRKNGVEAQPGVTTLAAGEELVWVCYPLKADTDPLPAFEVAASDGLLQSPAVLISIQANAPVCSINSQWPSACPLEGSDAGGGVTGYQAAQSINELDGSRWYKFVVHPGSEIVVILSELPDNYDVFLFKDILKSYLELIDPAYPTSLEKLANLGVEAAPTAFSPTAFSPTAFSPTAFSPTAFSPTAFSPTAFSPTAFSPTAFSPTAFSPTAFSPTAFSPTAFSPTAFSPTAFSPTAFSPTAFSPTAFSPTAFSPTAFSGAQVRSLVGLSAFPGTADEGIYLNAWDNEGEFYVCVRGRNGAYQIGVPFTLQIFVRDSACGAIPAPPPPAGTRLAATPGTAETLILVDSWGMMNPGHNTAVPSDATVLNMLAELNAFAGRPEVHGVVVDLGLDDWLRALHGWSELPDVVPCAYARNVVAGAIRQLVLDYRDQNPIKYLVLVGNDNVIPFFRYPDVAGIANENDYYPPVLDHTSSQASLRRGMILSQEAYGSKCGLSIHGSTFPVADISVGRLVETPDDVVRILNSYPAATGGVLPAPDSSLVVGYDFLADAAEAIKAAFVDAIPAGVNDQLIASRETSPEEGWTATQLLDKLLERRHDLIFLAGHYDGGRAMAADWRTYLWASQVAASPVDLRNVIVFGAGCHVGYSFVNEHDVPEQTPEPDWAQAFAFKQVAAFVGGTGYQYGDTDFVEYNERLYLEFARQLGSGSAAAPMAIGDALTAAKRRYLEGTPLPREIHEKTVLEVTLYGLPMIKIQMPEPTSTTVSHPSIFSGLVADHFETKPGAPVPDGGLGLQYQDVSFVPVGTAEERVTVSVYPSEDPTGFYELPASYLTGEDGQVLTVPCEPILPLFVRDASVPGMSGALLRGVGFRGGVYTDHTLDEHGNDIRPLTGAPAFDIRGVHAAFHSDFFYPILPWSLNYYGQSCGGSAQTLMYLFPAQYRSSGPGSDTGTRRTLGQLDLRLYCSGNVTDYPRASGGLNTPALAAAPTIASVADVVNGSSIDFEVRVTGDPTAGIQEVWVTYTATSGDWNGQWQSVDLVQQVMPAVVVSDEDSTLWKATLALPVGTLPEDVRYLVQAVNGVGLVSTDSKLGAFHIPGEAATPAVETSLEVSVTTVSTGVTAAAPLTSTMYGQEVILAAELKDAAGTSLAAGHAIRFGVGGQRWQAATDSGGRAAVTARLLETPGTYLVQACFLGEAAYGASSASGSIEIVSQGTQLTLERTPLSGTPFNMVATLTGETGQRLHEKRVAFLIEDESDNLLETYIGVTDAGGQAVLDAIPVLPGAYKITAKFGGAVLIPGLPAPGTLDFTDPCYLESVSSTVPLTLDYSSPIACTITYAGDMVVAVGSDLHLAATVAAITPLSQGDYSLAMIQYTLSDEVGTQVAEMVAPVMADGRSFAVVSGLEPAFYELRLQVVGGTFTSGPVTVWLAVWPVENLDQIIDSLQLLIEKVRSLRLAKGMETSLVSKLENARAKLSAGDVVGACGSLRAFINEVQTARIQKKIKPSPADELIAAATVIMGQLHCR